MTNPLANSVRIAAELRNQLKAEFSLEDGDEALETTIEGEGDLTERLIGIARAAVRAEAMAEAMKVIIKDNQDRKVRFEAKAEKLRGVIAWAMSEAGLKKIPAPDLTLSLGAGKPPLILDDVTTLLPEFARVKTEPDRVAIRAALEAGQKLSFARLGNARPYLTIRT